MPGKKPDIERTHISPKVGCEMVDVGIETFLGWIHSGALKASNISNSPARPRWRVAKKDLAAFLEARSNQQAHPIKPAKRRPRPRRDYV